MFRSISAKIHQISTTRAMIISLTIMVLFMVFVLPKQSENSSIETGSTRSPDTSFFYLPEELYQIANEYGPEGRQAYIKTRWTFDLIFPLVYVFFLSVGISWFSKSITGWKDFWKNGNLFPLLAGLFDYLENGAATWVMNIYPDRLSGLAYLTSIFSLTKWAVISLAFLVLFIFAIGALVARQKKKSGGELR